MRFVMVHKFKFPPKIYHLRYFNLSMGGLQMESNTPSLMTASWYEHKFFPASIQKNNWQFVYLFAMDKTTPTPKRAQFNINEVCKVHVSA